MNSGAFDFLSLPLIFHLTRIIAVIQYPCCILRPGTSRGVSVLGPCCTAGIPAGSFTKQIPKLNSKETVMPSLSRKDRVSLCSFTFSDGRRCRTPRIRNHPHFCFYHSQKEARARAAEKLGKDLAYFFSGDYLSACDLSTALSRLIPAVVRGDIKLRTARTVAYLAQTLLQAIHISQHEYINAFDTDDWRESIRNSVNSNHDYLFPPKPKHKQPESPQPQPQPAQPQTQAQPPASAPPSNPNPSQPAEQPAETSVNCHSDAVAQAFRPEESA